ncbi:hypothetical protein EBT31_07700 [bacterium]|nr:hypothetical protein [bacterium]
MSAIHQVLLAGSGAGYQIQNSLRLRASNSAYLSWTTGSAASDRKYATVSIWLKRGALTGRNAIYAVNPAGTSGASNQITMLFDNAGSNGDNITYNNGSVNRTTTSVYRDPSAHLHFHQVFDTTQATAADRVKTAINGVILTDINIGQDFSLNANTPFGQASVTEYIGRRDSGLYFDGLVAEIIILVGQALPASSFGQTDAATGVWVPRKFSGTFGSLDRYYKFADASAATAAAIGKDSSGNGLNATPSGISVTSGVTFDQMTDTPTNNYSTLNPLDLSGTAGTYASANLNFTKGTAGNAQAYNTIQMNSGKWYCEVTMGADIAEFVPGIITGTTNPAANRYLGQDTYTYAYYYSGQKVNSASYTSYGNSYVASDVIGIIIDADNGKLYFSKNGTVQNSGDPIAGTNAAFTGLTGPYRFAASAESGGVADFNFGQRPFAYTPPSGFKALNTANLSVPTIKKPSLYMDATLRTGTGATASVSSLGFQPDLVWIKSRSAATNNNLFDSARGATIGLVSQNANAEYTDANSLTAFNSNGYSLGSDASSRGVNINTNTYVDWAWKEGAAPGFDIVTYTGNGANRTVSHALGAAPACYVVKYRSGSNADEWFMYHKALGATKYIRWSQALGSFAGSTYWQDTAPTSSVFSIGTNTAVNTNTSLYVAYLWSEIDGFSKFGSYTGNASSDGPFVFCGFRPRWIYIKGDNATSGRQYDTARLTNEAKSPLYFNAANAESAEANGIDILSNGFKVRWSDSVINGSGTTYIFMAFAEAPFKYARAR